MEHAGAERRFGAGVFFDFSEHFPVPGFMPPAALPVACPAGGLTVHMATTKQTKAARKNVTKAQAAATSKKTISKMPKKTRTALGKQGAAVAQRKRAGGDSPKTRAELYEIAKRRDLPGRSKMGRDELARKLGEK
jgi:hypothetical protein